MFPYSIFWKFFAIEILREKSELLIVQVLYQSFKVERWCTDFFSGV